MAAAVTSGAVLGEMAPVAPVWPALLAGIWGTAAVIGRRRAAWKLPSLWLAVVFLTALRGQLPRSVDRAAVSAEAVRLRAAAQTGESVQLTGRIVSVPVLTVDSGSRFAPSAFGNPATTRFLIDVDSLRRSGQDHVTCGRCSVFVDGSIVSRVCGGDQVRLSGQLSWPAPPGNPGEFDLAAHLQRNGIQASVFVRHSEAVEVVHRRWWSPLRLASVLRQVCRETLTQHLDPHAARFALALLLGNRHQIPAETADAFVASGTMHLLAISGLHVGILFCFLVRAGNFLLATRRQSLLLAVAICVLYAVVTDLRPSVVRATVFCGVFAVGQLCGRSPGLPSVIAVTALLMVVQNPAIIWSAGAWLSFLSVCGLAQSWRRDPEKGLSEIPVPLTGQERAVQWLRGVLAEFRLRFGQMARILTFTLPLAVTLFHAVSPIGLLANVLLISFSALVLFAGFVLLGVGLLLPACASPFAVVLSLLLHVMSASVSWAGKVPWGHCYVADLPRWFLWAWYPALAITVLLPRKPVRRGVAAFLVVLSGAALLAAHQHAGVPRCTILAVGHGSCAVVESGDGRVFVIDGGSMGRERQVSRVLSRFLWQAGYRTIDGIYLSHADVAHYNALAGLLRKFPARQLRTTAAVLASESPSLNALLDVCRSRGVDLVVARDGAVQQAGSVSLTCLLPDAAAADDDDQRSLVVCVRGPQSSVLLPGDLEGRAAADVYRRAGQVDVLVSPHHGSPDANRHGIADLTAPELVVVSARDSRHRRTLERVFAASRQVVLTAESGAVAVRLDRTRDWTTHMDCP